jgi:ribokinase
MRVAVVGHVEWVEFVRVADVPAAGEIVHATERWEEPAGGGAVAAAELVRLGAETQLITALGDDELGRRALEGLEALGIRVRAQIRAEPTRRAVTLVDGRGERTIVVLGGKLVPRGPLDGLDAVDAAYFVSGDREALASARAAPVLVATARELETLKGSGVRLDALVGSGEDAGERYEPGDLEPPPTTVVTTHGGRGALIDGSHQVAAAPIPGELADTYGCGDCFAAGFTFALARGDDPRAAALLAAQSGAQALTRRGAHGP